jgi:predicted acyl esterase
MRTAPLAGVLYLAGSPTLSLGASSSGQDADYFGLVMSYDPLEPDPARAYTALSLGFRRARYRNGFGSPAPITPGEPFSLRIEMSPIAAELKAGWSLLLIVLGSLCAFIENPRTGEPPGAQTAFSRATHTVHSDQENPSTLTLPVMDAARGSSAKPWVSGGVRQAVSQDGLWGAVVRSIRGRHRR